jgi:hypothetical protein
LPRALSGERPLLESHDPEIEKEESMNQTTTARAEASLAATPARSLEHLSLGAIISGAVEKAERLVRQEAELAKSEIRQDLRAEVEAAKNAGIALVTAFSFLQMLLVAAVFALSRTMPGWAAALLVSAPLLVLTVVLVMLVRSRHVTSPLRETRRSLVETLQWARNRFA